MSHRALTICLGIVGLSTAGLLYMLTVSNISLALAAHRHDVEWYATHDAERNSMKHWCAADAHNPRIRPDDCSNAFAADSRVAARSFRH